MFLHPHTESRIKLAALLALAATASFAQPEGSIKVTNQSKQPWCLRMGEAVRLHLAFQCRRDPKPFQLSRDNLHLTCCIPPGETATLTFQNPSGQPFQTELGLVDRTGAEQGQLKVEAKPSWFGRWSGKTGKEGPAGLTTSVTPKTEVPEVLVGSDREDAVDILGESWWLN